MPPASLRDDQPSSAAAMVWFPAIQVLQRFVKTHVATYASRRQVRNVARLDSAFRQSKRFVHQKYGYFPTQTLYCPSTTLDTASTEDTVALVRKSSVSNLPNHDDASSHGNSSDEEQVTVETVVQQLYHQIEHLKTQCREKDQEIQALHALAQSLRQENERLTQQCAKPYAVQVPPLSNQE